LPACHKSIKTFDQNAKNWFIFELTAGTENFSDTLAEVFRDNGIKWLDPKKRNKTGRFGFSINAIN